MRTALTYSTARSFTPDLPPTTAQICTFSDGSYQQTDTGPMAILCPVELDGGEIIDTVAWFADQPGAWWLERRIATHLGDRALRRAAFLGKSIRLLPSPAAWLSSPEGSACVLDWTTDLRTLFREVPEIRCSTPMLARHLDRRLDEQVRHTYKVRVMP
jgi:hypothetical protein